MATKVVMTKLDTADVAADRVTAAIHRPTRVSGPNVLLTPGAGGDLDTKGLVALAEALTAAGHVVVRANLPFREAGRRAPKAESAIPGMRSLMASARKEIGGEAGWIVGGKSYGGRVASLAVADIGAESVAKREIRGLLFYGYPLHRPGDPVDPRVSHWPDIAIPALFLSGTRDPFCDLDLLREHLPSWGGEATLHVVEGGDHGLRVTAKTSLDGKPHTEEASVTALAPMIHRWATA